MLFMYFTLLVSLLPLHIILSSFFFVDFLAALPLPQVVILIVIPNLQGSASLHMKNLLIYTVLFQFFPRGFQIYPLYKEVTRTCGIITERAWIGAAFNFFLYVLFSHFSGSKLGTFVGEIYFAASISIFGLVFFALLIGNMQAYLQFYTIGSEEMRAKRRDAESWDVYQWMSDRLLPEVMRERIRRYEQYKWKQTRGINEQNIIQRLLKDPRRDMKRHLCLSLLIRVPIFEKMDDLLQEALCDRMEPACYAEGSYIIQEGDPVDAMLFIGRGDLLSMTTNVGRKGFFNSENLKAGDFCGEELFTWALDPQFTWALVVSGKLDCLCSWACFV